MSVEQRFTLAAIQANHVMFDRDGATDKACRLIGDAAAAGATIAAFGEAWLHGYPFFADVTFQPLSWRAMAEYHANAVEVPSPTTKRLCAAAKKGGIDVVIGVVERDTDTFGTVYCTLLFIGKEGRILGRHRKLKGTHAERAIWGDGDASGLRVYQRPYGRISGLNCWEHNIILPTYALAAQGTQIHVAAWPGREPDHPPDYPDIIWPRQLLLSRAFASQAACYVICAAGIRLTSDVPERYQELAIYEHTGQSCIIDPRGEIIAGPADGETILLAEGSMEAVLAAKSAVDAGGHYSRPDLLRLVVDRGVPTGLGFVDRRGADRPSSGCLDAEILAPPEQQTPPAVA
ncbi:Nitrilase 2 [Hyphomicrobiales bacterium]|nr:Nitrilase 2 [Hyphomicrobiales bacterium]CAH1701547.1 Nitrilase 2 [Hyphomicrobiales bacterium]CAI0345722.1 Nitrilase 2 [Hyphomicrobiales bacterium]